MRVVLATVAALSLAGCGVAEDPPTATMATGAPAPAATTLVTPPDATATFTPASTLVPPSRSASPVDPSEACPVPDPTAIFSDDAEMMDGSAMAERNLGVINQHVAAHPEVSTQPYLDWSADPPRVVVGFTGDLAPHREALSPQLADPERVLICQVPFSDAQLQVFAAEIVQRMSPENPIGSVGVSGGAVNVMVAEGNDAVVTELVATYGAAVRIELGSISALLPVDEAASTVAS